MIFFFSSFSFLKEVTQQNRVELALNRKCVANHLEITDNRYWNVFHVVEGYSNVEKLIRRNDFF